MGTAPSPLDMLTSFPPDFPDGPRRQCGSCSCFQMSPKEGARNPGAPRENPLGPSRLTRIGIQCQTPCVLVFVICRRIMKPYAQPLLPHPDRGPLMPCIYIPKQDRSTTLAGAFSSFGALVTVLLCTASLIDTLAIPTVFWSLPSSIEHVL